MKDRRRSIDWRWMGSFWLALFLTLAILVTQTAATPNPTPPAPSLNHLFIIKPGETSHVTSPIPVEAEMEVGNNGTLRLELVGEDGRMIARKVYAFRNCEKTLSGQENHSFILHEPASFCGGQKIHLSTALIFGIAEGNRPARLQLSILDADQRILILNSVSLTLRVNGTAKIVNSADIEQGIKFFEPEENVPIPGHTFVIAGEAPLTHILPLRVEVVTIAGKMLGSRMVKVVHSAGQAGDTQLGTFRVAIPLKMKTSQQALITISAPDEIIPGERFIASRTVTLMP